MAASMCERLQNQVTQPREANEQPQPGNRCSFHPSEEVKLFCKTCQMPVCIELCMDEAHDDHHTTTIKKAALEKKSAVQDLINEGRNILERYRGYIKALEETERTLNEERQQRDKNIIQAYDQMVQKLTKRKDQLLSESQQNHSETLEGIRIEKDTALANDDGLSAACDHAEQEMQQGWVEFLRTETTLTEVVAKYREKAAPTHVQTQPAVFQPTDTPVPTLGHVEVRSLPSAPIPAAPVSISAVMGIAHYHGSKMQEEHWFQSVKFGRDGSGTGQFDRPTAVTVSDEGEIFVTDKKNQRIQVFTLQGTFVRQFLTLIQMFVTIAEYAIYPDDVAMDGEGNLWVVGKTKSLTNFAVKYTKQGRVLSQFNLLKTNWGSGLAMDTSSNHIIITQTTGEIYKAEHGEVQLFRPDGKLVRTLRGNWRNQEFKNPQYITVDGEGNILVSDWDNHCVYVFDKDGQFLFQFGGKGNGDGQLSYPKGICTDRAGKIIVADSMNNRVEMFDKAGRFLQHVVTDINWPSAVDMTTQGQLVVTCVSCDPPHTVSIFNNY